RLPAAAVVSGVLGRLLRRRAFRHEGRIAGDGARPRASRVSQLVPAAVSVRLRDVQVCRTPVMPSNPQPREDPEAFRRAFAGEIAETLRRTPRQIPSKYLYDEL